MITVKMFWLLGYPEETDGEIPTVELDQRPSPALDCNSLQSNAPDDYGELQGYYSSRRLYSFCIRWKGQSNISRYNGSWLVWKGMRLVEPEEPFRVEGDKM